MSNNNNEYEYDGLKRRLLKIQNSSKGQFWLNRVDEVARMTTDGNFNVMKFT